MENFEKTWQSVLGELELLISRANFTTWFKNTFIAECGDVEIVIGVPNAFTKVWLEKKYHSQIIKALENVLSKSNLQVIYRVCVQENLASVSEKKQISKRLG